MEGINAAGRQLTPVQQAIVDEGGSQCGFCTVGFVMSLTGHSLSGKPATEKSTIAAIDGNICRCTGYKSLERAAATLTAELAAAPHAKRPGLAQREAVRARLLRRHAGPAGRSAHRRHPGS